MSLRDNAKVSIELGVEDFKLGVDGDEKRFISSIRNIYAGILLLFKHKLQLLSPSSDLLITKKISVVRDANGVIGFKGEGKKTIDYDEIKERFKSLNISADWGKMGQIRDIRNNLEHYEHTAPKEQAKKIIYDTFLVLKDFIVRELDETPVDILGDITWEYITAQKNIYQEERKAWEDLIEAEFDDEARIQDALYNLTCPECDIDLFIKTADKLKCKNCGKELEKEDYIELAFQNAYTLSVRDYKHGASEIICKCPECEREAYFIEDDRCYACDASGHARCDCGNYKEPDNEKCDDCAHMDYLMSQDD